MLLSRGFKVARAVSAPTKVWTAQKRLSSSNSCTSSFKSGKDVFTPLDTFARRHIGPCDDNIKQMCQTIGVQNLDELINKTVPQGIRLKEALNLGDDNRVRGERDVLQEVLDVARKNRLLRSFIGMGYYGTITPSVLLRNVMENPGWYTPYTPYQAEISQGRLEALLNFQTMVADLTGLPIANASLLDEATAAAEAMNMCFNHSKREVPAFFVAEDLHPQTLALLHTRAEPFGVKLIVGNPETFDFLKEKVCGALVQYPTSLGRLSNYTDFVNRAHNAGSLVVVASDLLALTLITPPGEWGADICLGSVQRFGIPLGLGGPHAAFFSCKDSLKRIAPGRLIGVSKDANGKRAYRMSLATREQHIRREKATSNICTSQALLANMAGFYATYHGPKGLRKIAERVHNRTCVLAEGLTRLGHIVNKHLRQGETFFDTIVVSPSKRTARQIVADAASKFGVNLRLIDDQSIGISFDECTTDQEVNTLFEIFKQGAQPLPFSAVSIADELVCDKKINQIASHSFFNRTSQYLQHPIFNLFHTEHEMLRYLFRLQSKDLGMNTSMISLGSCTMKLNATSEMIPITWPEFNSLHPFVPSDQTQGFHHMFKELEGYLAKITGFHAISLQPNAGSQGEYAGIMVIRKYHASRGEPHRNVCLIPNSAHGTNPASAAMAGMRIVPVNCDENGNVDIADLRVKAKEHAANLSLLMITYPSTHGVFEEGIREICDIVHQNGGQLYMDGANLNAQVGLTNPGFIGADVCHLNLHKTFCIPHGGGGPGMGPIGVAKHLAQFLPSHPVVPGVGGSSSIGTISAAPWGSASILPITYVYIKMMGAANLTQATKVAILNANYMARRLAPHYPIVYSGKNGFVAHEFILDCRHFKIVDATDIAKRLMDFNFHAPTLAFPIAGTLMVEPTESESKEELDRFCEAMITIRKEVADVEEGRVDEHNNALKNAPHTAEIVLSDKWDRPYSREQAAYPLPHLRNHKFWPMVSRIDGVYGDRNLFCTCPPMEGYSA